MSISGVIALKTIGAAKFKEQCLALMDQLDDEGLVITKHGKPVARITRFENGDGDLIGCLEHKIKVHGDMMSTGVKWEASDWEPDG